MPRLWEVIYALVLPAAVVLHPNLGYQALAMHTKAAPNTNSIRDWFLSVCWQKPFWNNITELSCLGFEFKIFTKPLHFEMVKIRNLCQKKCMKYLVTRFLFCFDFGCQVIFYQTFSSLHFLGTFLEKLSLWLKSKNINSVMVIQNLDQ